VQHIRV